MEEKNHLSPEPPALSGKQKCLLTLILLFCLISKLVRIEVPNKYIFDEKYHGVTAAKIAEGGDDVKYVYDRWTRKKTGKVYEWSHPPLSKLMMASGILLLGERPLGWRVSSVLMGTLLVLLSSWLAFILFKSAQISILTAYFLSLEGLLFVQSRLAMNDVHFIVFMLMTLITYLLWKRDDRKDPWMLLTSGALAGLAIGTKWTGLYLLGIIYLDHAWNLLRRKDSPSMKEVMLFSLAFLFMPAIFYVSTYIHFFAIGYSFDDFIKLQKGMWSYHTRLNKTHKSQSTPLQWIFNLKPVWITIDRSQLPEKVANIYNIGNSVILYSGLLAVAYMLIRFIRTHCAAMGILLACYFMFWLPWTFSPRIQFFYHYAPALPFLAIALSYLVQTCFERGRKSDLYWMASGVVIASLIWFIVFYPHMSLLHVPSGFAEKVYFALPDWKRGS